MKMPFGAPPPGLQHRLPDWQARLIKLANGSRQRPYDYGTFDCAVFAKMAVLAVTGVTLLPGIELPKGFLGAAKFLIRNDLANVEELAIAALGILPGDPKRSRPGDIIVLMMGGEHHLAVRVGDAALMPADGGLAVIDPPRWISSFAIGWDPNHDSSDHRPSDGRRLDPPHHRHLDRDCGRPDRAAHAVRAAASRLGIAGAGGPRDEDQDRRRACGRTLGNDAMSEPTPAERWQAFFDSWAIRVLTWPLGDRLAALAAWGLADDTPMAWRWVRVGLVAIVTAVAIVAMAALEMVALRLATDEWRPKCQSTSCVKAELRTDQQDRAEALFLR